MGKTEVGLVAVVLILSLTVLAAFYQIDTLRSDLETYKSALKSLNSILQSISKETVTITKIVSTIYYKLSVITSTLTTISTVVRTIIRTTTVTSTVWPTFSTLAFSSTATAVVALPPHETLTVVCKGTGTMALGTSVFVYPVFQGYSTTWMVGAADQVIGCDAIFSYINTYNSTIIYTIVGIGSGTVTMLTSPSLRSPLAK